MENHYSYDKWLIRSASLNDIDEIINIWREGFLEQESAADEKHLEVAHLKKEFQRHIELQNNNFKFWICLSADNEITGWQSILPFHPSPNPVVSSGFGQSSTYIKKGFQRLGIGKLLLRHALDYCREHSNIKYVFGLVHTSNTKSLQLCHEIGFHDLGELPKKNNRDFPRRNILVYEV